MIEEKAYPVIPASRRERLRVMMHDDILAAARQIVQENGFKELSMRALGRAVGVTAPALYDYFPSKNAVVDGLYLEGVRMMRQEFEAAVAAEATGPAKLQAIGHAYRRFALTHTDLFLLVFGRIDAAYRPGDVQKTASMGLHEILDCAVRESMAAGEMRAYDPEAVTQLLWTAVHGFVMLEVNQVLADCSAGMLDVMFEQNLELLNAGLLPGRSD